MADAVSKRSVIYDIIIETGGAKKGAQEAAQGVKQFGDELEKAATKGQRLTTHLRDLKDQLAKEDFGSEKFTKLSVEAAKVQDQIEKVNQRVRNLASNTKHIDALISAAQGLAGAFAVVQGASALLGKENEDLQKALLKVQASIAILNGLQQVQQTLMTESAAKTMVVTTAQKAYNWAVTAGTTATKAFRVALLATGAGVVLAGIGLLVTYWKDIAKWIGIAKDRQEDLNEATKEYLSANSSNLRQIQSRLDVTQKSTKDLTNELTRLNDELEKIPREGLTLVVNGQTIKQNTEEARKAISDQIETIKREIDRRNELLKETKPIDTELRGGESPEAREARLRGVETEEENITNIKREALQERDAAERQFREAQAKRNNEQLEEEKRLIQVRHEFAEVTSGIFFDVLQMQIGNSKAQLAFGISEIITNQAIAISKAISSAKGMTGIDYALQIATAVASATAAFGQIQGLLSQAKSAQANAVSTAADAFFEGTDYLERGDNPKGKDTIPVWANEGEAIIPTEDNAKYPGLAKAWINGNLDEFIASRWINPSLAVKAVEHARDDSRVIDYSEKFYRQLLAVNEGNHINKKAVHLLSSIDRKIGGNFPKTYGRD